MRRSIVGAWAVAAGALLACGLLSPPEALAGKKSDENKADCRAWCGQHTREGCHHCSATVGCGGGYSSMKQFGDGAPAWYACQLNSFGEKGEKNHQDCLAYCRSNPACVGCTSSACGKDIKLLKLFAGSGKDWYACQKTDWAQHSDEARHAAERWCGDYTRETHEACRIVASGKLCPDGFYESDRVEVSWGRDYHVCLQSKSGSQRVKDCSARAAADVEKALDWINANYETIVRNFEMQPNAYRDRRAHARLDRKFPHVTVQCEDDSRKCRDNRSLGGWSATMRWVNLCYSHHTSFCDLVGTIIHESGHNAWVDQDVSQHVGDPGPMNDTVYQFGYRAEDLCRGTNAHGSNIAPPGSRNYDYSLR
jgi:hypothetical protein